MKINTILFVHMRETSIKYHSFCLLHLIIYIHTILHAIILVFNTMKKFICIFLYKFLFFYRYLAIFHVYIFYLYICFAYIYIFKSFSNSIYIINLHLHLIHGLIPTVITILSYRSFYFICISLPKTLKECFF